MPVVGFFIMSSNISHEVLSFALPRGSPCVLPTGEVDVASPLHLTHVRCLRTFYSPFSLRKTG